MWSAAAVYNLHLANGTGFDPAIQTNVKTFTNPGLGNIAADFNGDGKTDMLVWHAPLNNNRYNLYLANGVGFEAAVNTGIQGFSNTGIANPISGDFNGDGLTDVLSYHVPFSNYRYNLNLNNGRGFNAAAATNLRATESIVRSQTGDVNGDGRTDVLIYATPNAGRYNLHLSLSQPPELMTRITNGLGAEINVSHKSLTDTSVYTKGTGASYPVQDVISSMSVVSQTTATNGLGGLNAVDYKYESLKVQVRGRGMQGFGRVVSTDNTAGITETTNYRLDFPFTGMALDSESMDSSGRILSKTVNTPGSTTANCGGYGTQFPFVASSRQESYEIQAYSSYVAKTQTTDYQYDGCGNALSVTVANYKGTVSTQDRHVSTSVNTYSGNPANWILGRLSRTEVTSTLPSGASATRVSSFTYDAATGFLTSETVEPNGGSMTTIYGYDPFGNKTSVTVSDNVSISRTTRTSYEANGRFPVAVTNAKNHTELHTYDPSHGGRMSLTGPNGLTTTWQYDLFGRMTLETRPDLTTTTTSYLWCGSLCVNGGVMAIRSTGSDGSDGLVTLDVLEREIGTRKLGFDGTWIQGLTEYDAQGRKIRVSAPHYQGDTAYWTSFDYDVLDRVIQQESDIDENTTGGRITRFEYLGLVTQQYDANNHQTTKQVNAVGRSVQVTDAKGGTTQYAYDSFGNLTQTTDAKGNKITMTYSIRGLKTSMTDPDMGKWTYSYNSLGELYVQKNAKGQQVNMGYDALGRRVSRRDVTENCNTTWTYDTTWKGALDNVDMNAPCANNSTTYKESYVYDNKGRLITTYTVFDGQTFVTSTSYDGQSRPETLTYPGGFRIKNIYNANGYQTEVRRVSSNALLWKLDHLDAFGNVDIETLGNGLSTTRHHDQARGHVAAIITGPNNGSAIQNLDYRWDEVGNLLSRQDHNQGGLIETFQY
ncbi:MAG: FG-GAP-like repeat-containing protein, partial [Nevskiales bacterium]